MAGPGLVFRAASSTAALDRYVARLDLDTDEFVWGAADDDSDIGRVSTLATINDGDEICARVEGTGASTSMEFWINPASGDPDDFGASDACLNIGGTAVRGTTCAATDGVPVLGAGPGTTDTGGYIGVKLRAMNVAIGNNMVFDDWRGGSCS
jgi:hypothetical protein